MSSSSPDAMSKAAARLHANGEQRVGNGTAKAGEVDAKHMMQPSEAKGCGRRFLVRRDLQGSWTSYKFAKHLFAEPQKPGSVEMISVA